MTWTRLLAPLPGLSAHTHLESPSLRLRIRGRPPSHPLRVVRAARLSRIHHQRARSQRHKTPCRASTRAWNQLPAPRPGGDKAQGAETRHPAHFVMHRMWQRHIPPGLQASTRTWSQPRAPRPPVQGCILSAHHCRPRPLPSGISYHQRGRPARVRGTRPRAPLPKLNGSIHPRHSRQPPSALARPPLRWTGHPALPLGPRGSTRPPRRPRGQPVFTPLHRHFLSRRRPRPWSWRFPAASPYPTSWSSGRLS